MNYEDKLKTYFGDMDFSFLNPHEEENLLVIENMGKGFEKIRYRGNDEIEAFNKCKKITHNDKCIIRARVVLSEVIEGKPKLILEYNELERIR